MKQLPAAVQRKLQQEQVLCTSNEFKLVAGARRVLGFAALNCLLVGPARSLSCPGAQDMATVTESATLNLEIVALDAGGNRANTTGVVKLIAYPIGKIVLTTGNNNNSAEVRFQLRSMC